MRAEDLHEVIHAEPFQTFDLMLADGTRLHISHPDWISHPFKQSRRVVVWTRDERVRTSRCRPPAWRRHRSPSAGGVDRSEPGRGAVTWLGWCLLGAGDPAVPGVGVPDRGGLAGGAS